jgi:hypothetical protein
VGAFRHSFFNVSIFLNFFIDWRLQDKGFGAELRVVEDAAEPVLFNKAVSNVPAPMHDYTDGRLIIFVGSGV